MKRTLLVLCGIALLFGFGCTKRPAVAAPAGSHDQTQTQGTAANEKEVRITIETVNGSCVIFDPGDVYLKRNQDKIKWCVVYKCSTGQVTVIIDDFRNQKSGPVTMRNPFGRHSDRDNAFDFGPLDPGGSDCNKVTGLSDVAGRYYYRIMVLAGDGRVLASLDPGVIIGD